MEKWHHERETHACEIIPATRRNSTRTQYLGEGSLKHWANQTLQSDKCIWPTLGMNLFLAVHISINSSFLTLKKRGGGNLNLEDMAIFVSCWASVLCIYFGAISMEKAFPVLFTNFLSNMLISSKGSYIWKSSRELQEMLWK